MSAQSRKHYWQGCWVDDHELKACLASLSKSVAAALSSPLVMDSFIESCDQLANELKAEGSVYQSLYKILSESSTMTSSQIVAGLLGIAKFLEGDSLKKKLRRELGLSAPLSTQRIDFQQNIFECWAPLGLLVHVAPANSFSVGVLSVVEGLLCGNVNFLKTSRNEGRFAQEFLAVLVERNTEIGGNLSQFVMVAGISSANTEDLQKVFNCADGVAAWGGEESVQAVKALTPPLVKFIDWGPKISFAYLMPSKFNCEETLKAIAADVCLLDQQACSSPQCIYVNTDSRAVINEVARRFADVLTDVSNSTPGLQPSLTEQAEITNVKELVRLGACLDEGDLIEAKDGSWRVLIDYRSALQASPLYRTVWVKPLSHENISRYLRPMRHYLQTASIAGDRNEIATISQDFISAGVDRITMPGHMHDSYMGEPHDGRYGLPAYSRRISLQLDARFQDLTCLEDLTEAPATRKLEGPVLTKEQFQALHIDEQYADLFFKSGGSSGEPKLSIFTYDDYHGQMYAAAEGLIAAGLRPKDDRCMNLFFGGGLYGGLISFFTILERLGAVQLPMGSHQDFDFVVDMIVRARVNTLFGMPSYLTQLFNAKRAELKAYGGIKKVYYGGEHLNEAQRNHLSKFFGISDIRSATYGSVDAGPLGFQCKASRGGVHHVHARLQELEIFERDADKPVVNDVVGRLLFTSKMRHGQRLTRYEIGDLGRWVNGPCPCGRSAPRFELLGRHGDIARIGTTFLNYRKIQNILSEALEYGGEMQIVLQATKDIERVVLHVERTIGATTEQVCSALADAYHDLQEVIDEGLVEMAITYCESEAFERTPGSGKLRHIIDQRTP